MKQTISVIVLTLLVSYSNSAESQSYGTVQSWATTKVIAGNGTPSFGGDGQSAIDAGLNMPNDVAVDEEGNLYIADTDNHRIRQVHNETGIVTTIAGNGENGFSGDGGPATNASLSFPTHIAVDKSGNLYISDTGNHSIRKVDLQTGVISRLLGTPDLEPGPIVVGDNGTVFYLQGGTRYSPGISFYTNKIYRLSSTGVTSVFYQSDESYQGISGSIFNINLDTIGNLLTIESWGRSANRIKRVSIITGEVDSILASPEVDYASQKFVTVGVDRNDILYFVRASSSGDFKLYRLAVKQLGGGFTTSEMEQIDDRVYTEIPNLITDNLNNVIFADRHNHQIRRITVGSKIQPSIEVSPSTLDFGNVDLTDQKSLQLIISNTGNMPLQISRVISSNPQILISEHLESVPIGGNTTLELLWSPSGRDNLDTVVRIISNDPDQQTVDIQLIGNPVFPVLSLVESTIDFGGALLDTKTELPLAIHNSGDGVLVIHTISSNSEYFSVSTGVGDTIRIQPRQSFNLPVIFQPASLDEATGVLSFQSNDPDQERNSVSLSGRGTVPDIFLDLEEGPDNDEKLILKGLSAGDTILAQIFVNQLPPINGFALIFTFDSTSVKFKESGFVVGPLLPNVLPIVTATDTSIKANIASTGGPSSLSDGLLGTASFILQPGFVDSTQVTLSELTFSTGTGSVKTFTPSLVITLSSEVALPGDFDGDGTVGFPDFIQFAQNFGKQEGDSSFQSRFDLDNDGTVGFPDFIQFAQNFGRSVNEKPAQD